MKKIKKNIFGIGLGLAMVLGVGLGFVPQQSYAEEGGGSGNSWYCFSGYTWSLTGACWFCKPGGCKLVDGTGYGLQSVCDKDVGGPHE